MEKDFGKNPLTVKQKILTSGQVELQRCALGLI